MAASSPQFVLPTILGSHQVNIKSAELVDHGRQDPFAPAPQRRKLMVSVFAPLATSVKCENGATSAYMPDKVSMFEDAAFAGLGVPNGTFSRFELPVCKGSSSFSSDGCDNENFPLVLFSPGLGNSRLLYSGIAQAVASAGFVVITIDHPYDANVVEFPDGTLVFGSVNDTTEAEIERALAVRVADAQFVLDSVLGPRASSILPSFPFHSLRPRVGLFGHSLGGATAAQTMLADTRFVGGLNMDGSLHGSVVGRGLDRPFLQLGREGHNRSTDASWAEFWFRSTGWKKQLTVLNSTHGTFEDLPLLAKVSGLSQALPPGALDPLLGSIDGQRALFIIYSYVAAFFRLALTTSHPRLLDGPSNRFPEVIFGNQLTGEL